MQYNTFAKQSKTQDYNGNESPLQPSFSSSILRRGLTSTSLQVILIFTRGRRWSKVAKRKHVKWRIACDFRFTLTAGWARRCEPSASEWKSQCEGGMRVQVDKIRCFIHLGTLLADFTTILAGDNRFPKVTRGFQQTFTPSSFPQVIQSNTIQYNMIQYLLPSSNSQVVQ